MLSLEHVVRERRNQAIKWRKSCYFFCASTISRVSAPGSVEERKENYKNKRRNSASENPFFWWKMRPIIPGVYKTRFNWQFLGLGNAHILSFGVFRTACCVCVCVRLRSARFWAEKVGWLTGGIFLASRQFFFGGLAMFVDSSHR